MGSGVACLVGRVQAVRREGACCHGVEVLAVRKDDGCCQRRGCLLSRVGMQTVMVEAPPISGEEFAVMGSGACCHA